MIKFFKAILLILNILFVLASLSLIGIGIWTAVDKIYVSSIIGDTLFSAASYMTIIIGFITLGICILGIYVLLRENLFWMKVYFILLCVCTVLLIIAAVLAVVFKDEVEDVMVTNMRESLIKSYGADRDITEAWDHLQTELQCCAISPTIVIPTNLFSMPYMDDTLPQSPKERELQDSWPIYKRTPWYEKQLYETVAKRDYVPKSCCRYDTTLHDILNLRRCQYFSTGPPTNYEGGLHNDYLNYEGCYQKAKELLLNQSDIIIAVGFVFAFVMVAGLVLTFFLLRAVSEEVNTEVKRRREPDNL